MQHHQLTTTAGWTSPIASITVLLIALSSTLLADPPAPASAAKLEKIDALAAPTTESHTKRQQDIKNSIVQSEEAAAVADKKMRSFLKRSKQEQQLNKTPSTNPSSEAKPDQRPNPAAKNTQVSNQKNSDEKKTNSEEEPTTIKIECDGGIYFDNENGILTYLKNIRLDESNSAFRLRCDDELKILFNKDPKEVKKDNSPGKKQAEHQEQEEQSGNSFSNRGDLKEIIATGNVRITGENSDGQAFLASGNTASYNASAGEMILKGGRPTLQQSANEYLQAAEDGQWIRLLMKDNDIESIVTSQGKWVMQAVPKK